MRRNGFGKLAHLDLLTSKMRSKTNAENAAAGCAKQESAA
ncbi:hypothetical protein SJ05684_a37420 (plasmid) [Sinorhizobium sojae CCBAU 05684]|uniref:Uncharacterized protein n=1 Tax=Sinorhizobium sojae CCBAU 05684 TaxID=716928 RepID=A0A249PML3_9HYPH|nr:hypothetical protein SJ05684_a37420 [Sinorhizobium sojae CCBAU 05684]